MQRALVLLLASAAACRVPLVEPPLESRIEVSEPGPAVSFVAIGDFGDDSPFEAAVAAQVHAAAPDIVLTLGDNNYPNGSAQTIDANIGKHYASFIAPYRGTYGPGAERNRFFPSLGNHDWRTTDLQPYLEYFELPGNERYYDFVWGPVHFFALDSDSAEPDGTSVESVQSRWLQETMRASESPWQVVYMHHAPYSSGRHGSETTMQWPYAQWGADVVLAGHDHHYERIERDGAIFLVNGLSGSPKVYPIGAAIDGSIVRFNETHGALFASATATKLSFSFVTDEGRTIDTFELNQSPPATEPVAAQSKPKTEAPRDFDAYED
ncbi:MAG: metallophosphoesterase [Nannocystaceae bacterium]|nr:metallophosphoesterase [Nannocystaceae bacterium]